MTKSEEAVLIGIGIMIVTGTGETGGRETEIEKGIERGTGTEKEIGTERETGIEKETEIGRGRGIVRSAVDPEIEIDTDLTGRGADQNPERGTEVNKICFQMLHT